MTGGQRADQPVSLLARDVRHPPAPVRLLHLGLGNFFRSHQAWYTQRAGDRSDGATPRDLASQEQGSAVVPRDERWGIAAFSGRAGSSLVQRLAAQGARYTLVVRGWRADQFEVVDALSVVHDAAEHMAWLDYFRSPGLAAVTTTVTEAGYLRTAGGGLDVDHELVRADIEVLRRDRGAAVRTVPGRLVAGFAARRESGAGPIALVPCDNLPDNGTSALQVVLDFAELVEADLRAWIAGSVAPVTTVVDRITPAAEPEDAAIVARGTGVRDACPVIAEPFSEWVLSGAFPVGRPRWEDVGAVLTDDPQPFAQRKLWLLNGAHSIFAYAGSALGHLTVADAAADATCREWVQQWWSEASGHIAQPAADLDTYRGALLARFGNPRIGHRLSQVAADGSAKLPVRFLPVIRAERAAGRLPEGALRALASWVRHLRGHGAPVTDVRARELVALAAGPLSGAVPRVLSVLDPALAEDSAIVAAVRALCADLRRATGRR